MKKSALKFFIGRPLLYVINLPVVRYSILAAFEKNIFTPRERMLDFVMSYTAASKLEGDYFEFGVYTGKTFMAAYHLAKHRLPGMHFYAFDSFQGLPESERANAGDFQQFEKGQFAASEEIFRRNLKKRGVDTRRVHVVAGWYKDTLNENTKKTLPVKKAAIVYVDCDLYESTVSALDFVSSYLEDGTLLLFDDWFTHRGHPDRGEQRAFREWLGRNPFIFVSEYQKFDWSGNSFIVHLKK